MTFSDLQAVASAILHLAKKNGYVVAKEIRAELKKAGLPEKRWKEVVEMLRESLNYRQGRYYYLTVVRPHQEAETRLYQEVEDVVRGLLKRYQNDEADQERRHNERTHFSRSVKVRTEDDKEFTALSKDLSERGIRLITDRSLLGRKLFISLPTDGTDNGTPIIMVTRILWTSAVADNLFENGGVFLEVLGNDE